MFDHILNFADEAAALAEPAMAEYWSYAEGLVLSPEAPNTAAEVEQLQQQLSQASVVWRGDIVIPGVSVYRVTGTETITPPEGEGDPYEQEIREPFPGWFAVVALPAETPELRDLPDGGCMLIADREAAERGELDFIVYLSPSFDVADLPITNVVPVFAGAGYPFHLASVRRT